MGAPFQGDIRPQDVQATFCAVLVDEWIRQGVRYVALSPGSRSTPIALEVMRARRTQESLVVDVFHDERSASFAALGAALAAQSPAIAVCTSGTAAAHFHAAVIEADLSGVPLVVCTADRPPELRDVGAPQTIDQTKLFGSAVRWFHDPGVPALDAASTWRSLAARTLWWSTGTRPGPVHLNLPFREPLVGDPNLEIASPPPSSSERPTRERWTAPRVLPANEIERLGAELSDRRGVIIAGRGCGGPDDVDVLARRLGWPVFIEPRSGCGAGDHTVLHGDSLVRVPEIAHALRPEVVLRLGEAPASKVLSRWVSDSRARQIHVNGSDKVFDADHALDLRLDVDPDSFVRTLADHVSRSSDDSWWSRWHDADRAARQALEDLDRDTDEWSAMAATRAVVRRLPPASHVVVSSSMPIRDVEWFAGDTSHVTIHANRGANGIDGVIATAVGVSRVAKAPTFVLIGDVAVVHDASTLFSIAHSDADVRIIVVNNDGGGIFHHLPQATTVDESTFEALYGTPHGIDFVKVAESLDMSNFDIDSPGSDLDDAIRTSGPSVIQLRTNRNRDMTAHRRAHEAIAERVRPFIG